MTVRVLLFQSHPNSILITCEEEELELPILFAPFDRVEVANALGAAGIRATVKDGVAGRWTPALAHQASQTRAERHQQERLRQAASVSIMKTAADDLERQRADIIWEKAQVDDRIRDVRGQISAAKTRLVTEGKYMPRREFQQLEDELRMLSSKSLSLQNTLSEIKRLRKSQDKVTDLSAQQQFIDKARTMLSREQFQAIWDAVAADEVQNAESD